MPGLHLRLLRWVVLLALCLCGSAWAAPTPGHAELSGSWAGEVRLPKGVIVCRLLLEQHGGRLSGWIWEERGANPPHPSEVVGSLAADGRFQLTTEENIHYIGHIDAAGAMAGQRPNGALKDASAPRFPFLFRRAPDAAPLEPPAPLPATTPEWTIFRARFRQAVQRRDAGELALLQARNFDSGLLFASTEEFLRQIDWPALSKASSLAEKRCAYRRPTAQDSYCIVDRRPCPECKYELLLRFEKGSDSQWRWAGMAPLGD